jgi:hypothetical protein
MRISIPVRRNIFLTAFLGLWLIGWAWGEITVPRLAFCAKTQEAPLFVLAWLGMWTLVGGLAIYVFLWRLVGKEIVSVDGLLLKIKKDIFGYGRLKEYELASVRSLRVAPDSFNLWDFSAALRFWGVGGGTIAFDYGASTNRFGAGVDEAEAKDIVTRIKERYRISD